MAGYSKAQIQDILYHKGHTVISDSRAIPYAVRVGESLIRRNLYALEDDTVVQQSRLYEQTANAIEQSAITLASHYSKPTLDNTPASYRLVSDIATRAQTEIAKLRKSIPEIAFQNTQKAYLLSWFGRAWILQNQSGYKPKLPALSGLPDKIAHLRVHEALSDAELKALLGRSPFDGDFELDIDRLLPDVRAALNSAMTDGVGIAEAMARVRQALGVSTDRRTGFKGNFNRVQTTTRTYILDASNQAAMDLYQANSDLLDGYEVLTAHDDRVCNICEPLDGEQHSLDDPGERPPYHPNCRCTIIPVVKEYVPGGGYTPVITITPVDPPADTFSEFMLSLGLGYLLQQWFGQNSPVSDDELDSSQLG